MYAIDVLLGVFGGYAGVVWWAKPAEAACGRPKREAGRVLASEASGGGVRRAKRAAGGGLPSEARLPPVGLASSRRRRRIASQVYFPKLKFIKVEVNQSSPFLSRRLSSTQHLIRIRNDLGDLSSISWWQLYDRQYFYRLLLFENTCCECKILLAHTFVRIVANQFTNLCLC